MAFYKHTDKRNGDGLAITDWNNLSSALAGSSGLTLAAANPADVVGIGTSAPDATLGVRLDVAGLIKSRGLRFDAGVDAHVDLDGALYRHGGQCYLTVDDHLYVRRSGGGPGAAGGRFHFNTTEGRLGVGGAPPLAALTIAGGGKSSGPDANMHITSECILFGGSNNGKQIDSAQISAGKHDSGQSLCIVGMGATTDARKVKIWAEGGLTINGPVTATRFTGDGSGLTNLPVTLSNLGQAGGKFHFNTAEGRLGVGGVSPSAPLTIAGVGKVREPDANMHITSDCILFGGANAGKQVDSAQISAGRHDEGQSLCIVGMGATYDTRQVKIWAEGGLLIAGKLKNHAGAALIQHRTFHGVGSRSGGKDTGVLVSDWAACIAGFDAGHGDLLEDGGGADLLKCYLTESGGRWKIVCNVRTHGETAWTVHVLFISKQLCF
jgi:hypothetical protein